MKEQIENLRIQNEELNNQMSNLNEGNKMKIDEYEKQIKNLEDSILKKDEEIFILKSQLDNTIISNKKNLQKKQIEFQLNTRKKFIIF